jgi:4-amino-4-deoxy-L-arabinose transferase-like glycosyltransferase
VYTQHLNERREVRGALDRLSTDINKNSGAYLALFLITCFVTTAAHALRPFWFDELHTFYLAKLPTISASWAAVRSGADLNPPLLYAVTHISQRVLGANELATRIPSILALSIVFLSIYHLLRKRISRVFAFCGAMVPLLTMAYAYGSEARPTALVLAGAAVATVSWNSAIESSSRRAGLAGITVGLAIALLSHVYAVVLAIPFAAGEIVRSVKLRHIDWPVWAAFAASTPALIFYPALARHSGAGAVHVYSAPAWAVVSVYRSIAEPGLPWFALAFFILASMENRNGRQGRVWAMPPWELAWVIGMLSIPVVLIAASNATGTVFAIRYSLPAILGLAVLLGQAFYRVANGDDRAGSAVLALFGLVFVGSFVAELNGSSRINSKEDAAAGVPIVVKGHPLLSRVPAGDEPIVVGTATWFLEVDHYATPEMASRLYHVSDPDAALRFTGSSLYETGYEGVTKWFPVRGHFARYSEFKSHYESFFVYCSIDDKLTWLPKQLAAERMPLRLVAYDGHALLLEVRPPKN